MHFVGLNGNKKPKIGHVILISRVGYNFQGNLIHCPSVNVEKEDH